MGSFRLIRAGSREGPPRREVISCPTYSGLAEPASNFPDKSRKASGTKLWEKTRIILPIVVNREVIGLEKFPSLLLLVFEAFRGNRCFNERFNLRSRGKSVFPPDATRQIIITSLDETRGFLAGA